MRSEWIFARLTDEKMYEVILAYFLEAFVLGPGPDRHRLYHFTQVHKTRFFKKPRDVGHLNGVRVLISSLRLGEKVETNLVKVKTNAFCYLMEGGLLLTLEPSNVCADHVQTIPPTSHIRNQALESHRHTKSAFVSQIFLIVRQVSKP